jgi:hypothetical protein
VPKVEGINEVLRLFLRKLRRVSEDGGKPSVIVGYTAEYALHVHENLEAAHGAAYNVKYAAYYKRGKRAGQLKIQRGPEQQAKFLERPAREMKRELAGMVRETVAKGSTLTQGLLLAGGALLHASQQIVPVDTGYLKNSGFMRPE